MKLKDRILWRTEQNAKNEQNVFISHADAVIAGLDPAIHLLARNGGEYG